MPYQLIFLKALEEPAIGYAASPKFKLAPFRCPRCGAHVWVRLRRGSTAPIGATCEQCTWLTTYLIKATSAPAPKQQSFLP